MEFEIELKLLAPSNAGDIIERDLLPQLSCAVSKKVVELSNYYFDTAERTLRKNDIGLRIRGNANQLEQTLKTAGKSVGGLHQRPEYNVQLADRASGQAVVPDLSLFDKNAWPDGFDVQSAQQNIATLFVTHFERRVYLLDLRPGSQIEMVWDYGAVSANEQSVPICEIELELKKGDPVELFILAKQLLNIMPLTIGSDSKAARGYRLADNLPIIEPSLDIANDNDCSTSTFSEKVENALVYWQYFSTQLSVNSDDSVVANIVHAVNLVGSYFLQYKQENNSAALDDIHFRLQTLIGELQFSLEKAVPLTIDKEQSLKFTSKLLATNITQLQLDIVQLLFDKSGTVND